MKVIRSHLPYLDLLDRVAQDVAPGLIRKHGIETAAGAWLDSAALKLQKESWTDGGIGQGIFFSIWVGEKQVREKRFNYNIHALKLRQREGFSIKPREFAAAFRARREFSHDRWPNMRTDFGPQTLMQGWLPLQPQTFHHDVLALVDHFVMVHPVIDEMLEERRSPGFPACRPH